MPTYRLIQIYMTIPNASSHYVNMNIMRTYQWTGNLYICILGGCVQSVQGYIEHIQIISYSFQYLHPSL